MKWFGVLTVQQTLPGYRDAFGTSHEKKQVTASQWGVVNAATRSEVHAVLLSNIPEQVRGGSVVFFSAEPEEDPGA